jgi:hypothetical protein
MFASGSIVGRVGRRRAGPESPIRTSASMVGYVLERMNGERFPTYLKKAWQISSRSARAHRTLSIGSAVVYLTSLRVTADFTRMIPGACISFFVRKEENVCKSGATTLSM